MKKQLISSKLFITCKSMINFSSLRFDNSFFSWILLLSESAWNSCFWISALKFARICSFCLSWRILMVSFSISRLGFCLHELSSCTGLPVLVCVWNRTELATNFLHKSDKLVFGPLILLYPEWTVVKIALSRWSHRRVPRHTSTRAPCPCRRIPPGRWFL